jgi:hypothetical protein
MRPLFLILILAGLIALSAWAARTFAAGGTLRPRIAVGILLLFGGIVAATLGLFSGFANSMMPGGPEDFWEAFAMLGGLDALVVGVVLIAMGNRRPPA